MTLFSSFRVVCQVVCFYFNGRALVLARDREMTKVVKNAKILISLKVIVSSVVSFPDELILIFSLSFLSCLFSDIYK